jgi:hypothetical protein
MLFIFRVLPKPPKVNISTNLQGPAYIGEKLPILITLENGEDDTVNLEIEYNSSDVDERRDISFDLANIR